LRSSEGVSLKGINLLKKEIDYVNEQGMVLRRTAEEDLKKGLNERDQLAISEDT
jgi:hypothetical protein